ncbi:AI-2E family transporter [Halomarina halobia]|uniref:AI-2E family transporter n=1 Tax=Halomarina halobia TaxID=3033386 RepID=A0ABD6A6R0_9EURY|nr:AI-2E family transporter [Halomarina sp. PSR21]
MLSRTDFDVDTRAAVLWAMGGAITAAVAYAVLQFLGSLVFALFAYYASRPIYRRLSAATDHPDLAVTATVLLFTLPVLAVVGYGFFVAVQELDRALLAAGLGQYRPLLEPYLRLVRQRDLRTIVAMLRRPEQAFGPLTQRLFRRGFGYVLAMVSTTLAVLGQLFLALVYLFYLLRDDRRIADWFRRTVNRDADLLTFAEGVDEKLGTLFFGNLLTIVTTGAIAAVTYVVIDRFVPAGVVAYPVLLGALIGIGTLVPAVGIKIVYVPYTAVLLFDALAGETPLWFPALFFVVSLIVVDTVPDYFVRSYLSAGDLNFGLVLLAYVLGTMVFGWLGVFLGPILLALFVQFARGLLPKLTNGTLSG